MFRRLLHTSSNDKNETTPRKIKNLALYYYPACPFCIRVMNQMKKMNLELEMRNILTVGQFKQELIEGGGKKTVPCLKIDNEDGSVDWMYESTDICDYLREKYVVNES